MPVEMCWVADLDRAGQQSVPHTPLTSGNVWIKMSRKKPPKFTLSKVGFQTQSMCHKELNCFSTLEDVKHAKHED